MTDNDNCLRIGQLLMTTDRKNIGMIVDYDSVLHWHWVVEWYAIYTDKQSHVDVYTAEEIIHLRKMYLKYREKGQ